MNEHYLNENGKFKRGNPGRQKGSKNKSSPKAIFMKVFEDVGGVDAFVAWVKKSNRNRSLFYQMYAKMLPTNVDFGDSIPGDGKVTLEIIRTPAAPKPKEKKDSSE